MRNPILKTGASTSSALGLLIFGALALSGCFQQNVTLGLACGADDQCGSDQVCDSEAFQCVELAKDSDLGPVDTDSPTTDTNTVPQDPCAVDGDTRCEPSGVNFQQCVDGSWMNFSCNDVCQDANEPPGKQAGACVGGSEDPSCVCADSIGGECEGNEPASCTEAGLLQFCTQGRFFGLMCSTKCADDDYSVGGPCVSEGQGQGSAACTCADGEGGTCTIAEQFAEGCENATFKRRCVDEIWWLTDCELECERFGQTGGTCTDQGDGNFECSCG